MTATALHEGWTVRAVGGEVPAHLAGLRVPATVPGCVHLDLLAAGLIPDPHLDRNERELAWIGRVDWRYETTVQWPGTPQDQRTAVDLVALGLDTVATVELNGTVLGRTRNMHRSHRFPAGHLLRPGENLLAVTFTGALTAAEQAAGGLGARPHVNRHPYNAVRKMACDYGWDWGPETLTVGIWRPIRLESRRGAAIGSVRPLVELDGGTGVVRLHVELRPAGQQAGPLRLDASVGGVRAEAGLPAGQTSAVLEVRVPQARLWWPHGYGE